MKTRVRLLSGDCRALLAREPAGSVQCCVTSSPYYGLRDYGVKGQLGNEKTPALYLLHLDRPYFHARHYLGWSNQLTFRLQEHAAGGNHSTALLRALAEQHIGWRLSRLWRFPSGGEGLRFETKLKRQHAAHRVCPLCHPGDFGPTDLQETAVCDGYGHLVSTLSGD